LNNIKLEKFLELNSNSKTPSNKSCSLESTVRWKL